MRPSSCRKPEATGDVNSRPIAILDDMSGCGGCISADAGRDAIGGEAGRIPQLKRRRVAINVVANTNVAVRGRKGRCTGKGNLAVVEDKRILCSGTCDISREFHLSIMPLVYAHIRCNREVHDKLATFLHQKRAAIYCCSLAGIEHRPLCPIQSHKCRACIDNDKTNVNHGPNIHQNCRRFVEASVIRRSLRITSVLVPVSWRCPKTAVVGIPCPGIVGREHREADSGHCTYEHEQFFHRCYSLFYLFVDSSQFVKSVLPFRKSRHMRFSSSMSFASVQPVS